ncbi:MAG: jacalin-like lectin [Xanthomonadales bacterium]|nr:jacalin-like lectin [Xanthomonadales bacterium]
MKVFYKKIQIIFVLSGCLLSPFVAFADTGVTLLSASGGAGGSPFVDMALSGGGVASITVKSGNLIDSIQLTYRYGNKHVIGLAHGGKGGKSSTFRLSAGEVITELGGRSGKYVDSLYIRTSKNRVKKWGGKGGGNTYRFTGSRKSPITGIWGRSGKFLDAIGAVKPKTEKDMPATPGSGGVTKRSINSKGYIVTTYPDGSRTERFPGGMEKFNPDGTSMGKMLFSTAAPAAIPPDPPDNFEEAWLTEQSDGLLSIIRTLVGGDETSVTQYLESEKVSLSIYEKINKRRRVVGDMVLP